MARFSSSPPRGWRIHVRFSERAMPGQPDAIPQVRMHHMGVRCEIEADDLVIGTQGSLSTQIQIPRPVLRFSLCGRTVAGRFRSLTTPPRCRRGCRRRADCWRMPQNEAGRPLGSPLLRVTPDCSSAVRPSGLPRPGGNAFGGKGAGGRGIAEARVSSLRIASWPGAGHHYDL
jgi:hypothetical protein